MGIAMSADGHDALKFEGECMRRSSWVLALAIVVGGGGAVRAGQPDGTAVYQRYCAGCHGERGDGHGPAAAMLLTKPRDFTQGVFKFRSTASGELPTDDDLYRIITNGVYRTSMPGWSLLPDGERRAVIRHVKSFYPPWAERGGAAPVPIPARPADLASEARVQRGRQVYELLECSTCHGMSGRGDGPSAAQLPADAWGNPQKPFDFTRGRLKSGAAPEDVYRTFMTGLNGTAMPSFADIFAEPDGDNIRDGDGWNLVAYVLSLRAPTPSAGKEPQP
jgi:mono/diheme cytochrome c family protein